jgi:hypothetical protein
VIYLVPQKSIKCLNNWIFQGKKATDLDCPRSLKEAHGKGGAMASKSLEIGKTWVVASLMSHGKKSGFTISNAKFDLTEGDVENSVHTLSFHSEGILSQTKFKNEDLELCSKDYRARERLLGQIRRLIRSM